MSDTVRLTMLTHGMTGAMSAGRFPVDEPLSELGIRQCTGLNPPERRDRVLAGPEVRARQTAQLCGWQPAIEPGLADLDVGYWRGQSLTAVNPGELREWMTDPASAPHGGESLVALQDRVAGWLDSVGTAPGRVVAITHPAVVRAAIVVVLAAPPESFWRIDIEPASWTTLHRRKSWTLRAGIGG